MMNRHPLDPEGLFEMFVAVDPTAQKDEVVVGKVEWEIDNKPPKYVLSSIPWTERRHAVVAYIGCVAVAFKWWKKRVGSTMLPRALEEIRARRPDVVAAYLVVGNSNTPAIKLYEKTNFTYVADYAIKSRIYVYRYPLQKGMWSGGGVLDRLRKFLSMRLIVLACLAGLAAVMLPLRKGALLPRRRRPTSTPDARRSAGELVYRPGRSDDRMDGKPLNAYGVYKIFVAVEPKTLAVVGKVEWEIDLSVPDRVLYKLPEDQKAVVAYIGCVEVIPAWRKKRVGSTMLPKALDYIRVERPDVVATYLYVDHDNRFAGQLYRKSNFTIIDGTSTCVVDKLLFLMMSADVPSTPPPHHGPDFRTPDTRASIGGGGGYSPSITLAAGNAVKRRKTRQDGNTAD
ncbi:hypothetical protein FOZ61_006225 [Perkinsus olseni]|uniref:N-alpha-acetyltransferase 60 n=1 Tax=Perkinsus olseni TaxID=32597 RepID=A0A7J6LEB3_PEROL|nr:hypothetical protein FOZ61_006225 [Perkinsus olseni]